MLRGPGGSGRRPVLMPVLRRVRCTALRLCRRLLRIRFDLAGARAWSIRTPALRPTPADLWWTRPRGAAVGGDARCIWSAPKSAFISQSRVAPGTVAWTVASRDVRAAYAGRRNVTVEPSYVARTPALFVLIALARCVPLSAGPTTRPRLRARGCHRGAPRRKGSGPSDARPF